MGPCWPHCNGAGGVGHGILPRMAPGHIHIEEYAVRTAMPSCRCGFEQIEQRLMLAFGAFVSAAADSTSLAVVVDYTSANQSTIGPGDITFMTAGRGAVGAASVLGIVHRANSV